MEKQQNPERISPELTVHLGHTTIQLTYYNSMVFYYNENFNHMRHAFYEPGKTYIFNTDLVDTMVHNDWPSMYQPWPEAADEDVYVQYEMEGVEERLKDGGLEL